MARTDKLGNFLTDVANAIREKKGTTDAIKASDFDSEITNLPSGGTTITKGIVINSVDEDGYVTDASIVGMTEIPPYYLYYASYLQGSSKSWLYRIGDKLHLPSNLTKISQYGFGNCHGLAITELPDTITEIQNYAFNGCSSLKLSKLPSNLKTIGTNGFYLCGELTITELPSGLTNIDPYAFYNCKKITVSELPSGVIELKSNVFSGCTSMTELNCKGNITSIAAGVFRSNSDFDKFVLENVTSVPTLSNSNAFQGTKIASGTGYIYVPDNLVESFKTATNWSTYANQIKGVSELV